MSKLASLILLAVLLLGTMVHHEKGHHNYKFRDQVCTSEKLKPAACDWLYGIFEEMPVMDRLLMFDAKTEKRLYRTYIMCCSEA